ncbi:hypothetical protein [Terriglobus roseus]|uniref:Uncharacterized protein n=1 Tax=Terriglobus roseus TaxID=392734 RepID=A0A1G7N0P4_9BACT|nr:hypothetical protein [Terriglobus roseus]SDF67501.1 hypothetical protein SAMN05444167_2967 [Terriglobus roseus]
MTDLRRALGDIHAIRKQVADRTEFRGYGPVAVTCTGLFAVIAAIAQPYLVPDPSHMPVRYLAVWFAAATLSLVLSAITVYTRSRRMHSGLSDEMIRMAAQQFVPSVGAGLLVTLVLVFAVPQGVWMLPGLWQVIFSLGVFASCRSLPKTMFAPACLYLGTGVAAMALGDARALSPWVMGVPFALGQMLIATVLRFDGAVEEDVDA